MAFLKPKISCIYEPISSFKMLGKLHPRAPIFWEQILKFKNFKLTFQFCQKQSIITNSLSLKLKWQKCINLYMILGPTSGKLHKLFSFLPIYFQKL